MYAFKDRETRKLNSDEYEDYQALFQGLQL